MWNEYQSKRGNTGQRSTEKNKGVINWTVTPTTYSRWWDSSSPTCAQSLASECRYCIQKWKLIQMYLFFNALFIVTKFLRRYLILFSCLCEVCVSSVVYYWHQLVELNSAKMSAWSVPTLITRFIEIKFKK